MNKPREDQNPPDEETAICAYLIWEQEGKPKGQHHVHWSNAQNQLMACNAHDEWYPPS